MKTSFLQYINDSLDMYKKKILTCGAVDPETIQQHIVDRFALILLAEEVEQLLSEEQRKELRNLRYF